MKRAISKKTIKGTFPRFWVCPHTIAFIIALIMIFTIIPVSYGIESNDTIDYQGTPTYKALYNNVNFVDIKNHWARESIYRMASLSIIRGMGQNKFNPNGTLTREQSLALLVRLMGLEAEAQKSGQDSISKVDTGGYSILSPNDY